jgi:hypothetical protein
MARAVVRDPMHGAGNEPLYEVDPITGVTVDVFYATATLASSFSACPGWYWRTWRGGSFPDTPVGPFSTQYAAYRNVALRRLALRSKASGKRDEV